MKIWRNLQDSCEGEYNAQLTSEHMQALAGKYLPNNDFFLAEQDW